MRIRSSGVLAFADSLRGGRVANPRSPRELQKRLQAERQKSSRGSIRDLQRKLQARRRRRSRLDILA